MRKDIYDILGVSHEEDVYSNLLAEAFREAPEFRSRLLARIWSEDAASDDWECRVHFTVHIGKGRAKDVPDVVMWSKARSKALVIENKCLSTEGWMQTQRYSSEEFKASLAQTLEFVNPDIRFLYLSLDGAAPDAPDFDSLSYRELAGLLPEDPRCAHDLALLLGQFRQRVEQYSSIALPAEGDDLLSYLRTKDECGFDTRLNRFVKVASSLELGRGFEKPWHGTTGHRGSGWVPLFVWGKPDWSGENVEGPSNGCLCYNIHYELQYDPVAESLRLYLHYETNPYMGRGGFRKLPPDFQSNYMFTRQSFWERLRKERAELTRAGWELRRTRLRLAQHRFTPGTTFGGFRTDALTLTDVMTPVVDSALKHLREEDVTPPPGPQGSEE